jgi:hypothetical protein
MRVSNIFAAAVLGLAFCGPALAQSGEAPSALPIDASADSKVVCVLGDPPTGSRMGAKKICHTNAEWRTIHSNSQQLMNTFQDRSAVGHGEGG